MYDNEKMWQVQRNGNNVEEAVPEWAKLRSFLSRYKDVYYLSADSNRCRLNKASYRCT